MKKFLFIIALLLSLGITMTGFTEEMHNQKKENSESGSVVIQSEVMDSTMMKMKQAREKMKKAKGPDEKKMAMAENISTMGKCIDMMMDMNGSKGKNSNDRMTMMEQKMALMQEMMKGMMDMHKMMVSK